MHLDADRLHPQPDPPLTEAEERHVAACVRCRSQRRLIADHLHPDDTPVPGMQAALTLLAEARSLMSQALASDGGALWAGSDGVLVQDEDGRWWRAAGRSPEPGAEARQVAIQALRSPLLVPWRVQTDATGTRHVETRWLQGTRLDGWLLDRPQRAAVVRVMIDVAGAIVQLHRAGLCHGSIDARAVLVTRERGALLFSALRGGSRDGDGEALRRLIVDTLGERIGGDPLDVLVGLLALGREPLGSTSGDGRLLRGSSVDRYVVDDVVGRGAMATVYRVHHRVLGTTHAMKVLRHASPPLARRMVQEGQVQASLQHPGIVPVTDVLEMDGAPALVMPLIDGPSLGALLATHRPSTREALVLGRQLIEAVAFAHRHGVVHRDLKPSNVLLDLGANGFRARVVDFGLAKMSGASVRFTQPGELLGTVAYAAPEQLQDSARVEASADAWALGCLLVHLLTGKLPLRPAAPPSCSQPSPPGVTGPSRPQPSGSTSSRGSSRWIRRVVCRWPRPPCDCGSRSPSPCQPTGRSPARRAPFRRRRPAAPAARWFGRA